MTKRLINHNGNIEIRNIKTKVITDLATKMTKTDCGQCVCRQFVLGKKYTMLITNVYSRPLESNKTELTVALWPDNEDATYYVTRTIPFYITDTTLHIWESFCEAVSGGKAIWEKDLLGIFFVGHIDVSKVKTPDGIFSYEHIYVDKYLDRLDPVKVNEVLASTKSRKSRRTTVMDLDDEG